MKVRVLSWNIHKCKGPDRKRSPHRVLDTLARLQPDIAILQEADLRFGRKRCLLDEDIIFEYTGMVPCMPATEESLGWRGNIILIRQCDVAGKVQRIALPSLEPRGALLCRISIADQPIDVIGMHLGLLGPWRRAQAAAIAAEIEMREPVPIIIAGDSNDWGPRGMGLAALETMLGRDSHRVATFPQRLPMLKIDRVLAGRGAVVEALSVARCAQASDHLPVIADVAIDSGSSAKHLSS